MDHFRDYWKRKASSYEKV